MGRIKKEGNKSEGSEPRTFELKEVVLGKIRGYPPWPGMVVAPESAPDRVMKERPAGKKSSFYLVRFFPTADYSWLPPKEITKLKTHEIESYINEPYRKSGDLLTAYKAALDPRKWEEEHESKLNEAREEEAGAEVDQLDSDEDADEDEDAKPAKKRKRISEGKAAKVTKAGTVRKKPGPKKGSKSKATVESEDDGEDEGKAKKKAKTDDPESDENAKKVREWRHRLQKAFLSQNKAPPKEEDMPTMNTLFAEIENYKEMSIEYLTFSKIGKVMRHIAALEASVVPKDSEYHFRDRAKALVDQWHRILPKEPKDNIDIPTNGVEKKVNGTETKENGTVVQGTDGDTVMEES